MPGASRSALLLLPLAGAALAVGIAVEVGRDGTLAFSPPAVNADVGDIVTFTFWPKNHTVTQVTFSEPCTRPTGHPGVDSGFVPVAAPGPGVQPMALNVATTAPLWFACMQLGHCQQGMVFAINPTPERTFAAFQARAMGVSGPAQPATTDPDSGSGSQPGLGDETGAEGSPPGATETQPNGDHRKERAKSATFEIDPVATSIEYDVRAPPIAIEATLALAENPDVTTVKDGAATPGDKVTPPSGDEDVGDEKPVVEPKSETKESSAKPSREASATKDPATKDSTTVDTDS
ncbi:hypothetical protein AURDEDRAFT_179782 [Auricularia subglabra TFB-10046 SS5]|nr:hypothetical protein AURDEDRAFT_179782 [Auricularia subglabra TFB-10046 SS5]